MISYKVSLQIILSLLIISFLACRNKKPEIPEQKFNRMKWIEMVDGKYIYRNAMVKDVIMNNIVHGVKYDYVLNQLGQPNRIDNGHLFYSIVQDYFPNTKWPIHTKTLVIKLTKDSTVEWRKIHE